MKDIYKVAKYAVAFTALDIFFFFLIYVLVGIAVESLEVTAALNRALYATSWRFFYYQVFVQFVFVGFSVLLFRSHPMMAALGAAFLSFVATALLSPIGLDVPKLFLLHYANTFGPGIAFVISSVLSVLALRKAAGGISRSGTFSGSTP